MRNIFISFLLISTILAQESEKLLSNPCKPKQTCGECISANPLCAWCKKENFTDPGKSRCDFYATLQLSRCQGEIEFPSNQKSAPRSRPLSSPGAKTEDVVQIVPQEVTLRLRPNDPYDLELKFRQAKDYPVDLYYLMDLSKSMEDDKDKLASLGNLLSEQMGKITQNFQLGFGSFVDKTVMPYVSTVPAKLEAPCTGCAAPYGFKNHMSLNASTDRFSIEVRNAQVSGNLDAPEGGFDAIMQAVVCQEIIGWREKSRKMLLFSTDSGFHYAGDGKLGGIVKPNDGNCHLDKNGLYTESTTQDYPSLSQIRHKISERKVHIIFAVTSGQVNVYKTLSENLEGAHTGQLENDSSNVVQLIREQYDQITSEVEMRDTAPSNIKVNYYSHCLDGQRKKTNICKGLKVGNTVSFEAEIELTSCPKDRNEWFQSFEIYPVGLNEALTVNVEMICECDCETPRYEEVNSPKCNSSGTFECGICKCNPNKFGRFCECDSDYLGRDDDALSCRMPNSTVVCSGRGICSCGVCMCHTRENPDESIYGEFCECDNFSCVRADGKLCSGPTNGKCNCGVCECASGWTGSACECNTDTKPCIGLNNEICSGNGECVCGSCVCKEKHSGPHCEDCPTCLENCAKYLDCVQCQAFGTGKLKDNCVCSFNITLQPEVKTEKDNERLCVFKDEDDCKFTFVYGYDEKNNPKVRVQETKECPPPLNILMIVLAVIGGIVAIGLCLLLIWKLLTTIHDRREFAKFEKERQMAKWDTGENPIYKQATTTFQNPTYGKK